MRLHNNTDFCIFTVIRVITVIIIIKDLKKWDWELNQTRQEKPKWQQYLPIGSWAEVVLSSENIERLLLMPKHFTVFAGIHCTGTNYLVITMLKTYRRPSIVRKKEFWGHGLNTASNACLQPLLECKKEVELFRSVSTLYWWGKGGKV